MKHTPLTAIRHALFVGLVTLAVASTAPGAYAGHYRLPVANFINQEETTLLQKAGISTTLALLDEVKTHAQRKRVAQVTGISVKRLEALAGQVDLLRIDGIGPTVVRLMLAAGVKHARGLGAESADVLLGRMKAANTAQQITSVMPREGQLAAWIAAAKRLGSVIEGVP